MAKNTTPARAASPPGPGRAAGMGQGDKYALVRSVLGTEPLPWIATRRKKTFRREDGTRGQMSFRELSDEITRRLRAAGHREEFVTIESVRRWYRAAHPTG